MSALEWIAYFFGLLPIMVFLFFLFYRKSFQIPLWVILLYSIYSFANDTKAVYDHFHDGASLILLYIFTIVEYSLFALFIHRVLGNPFYKRALILCSVLFIAFGLFNILFQPQYQFDALQTSIEVLILLVFCILFLFEQINKPEITFIYASYKFWIITGILIYVALNLFLFGFASTLPNEIAQQYWFINNISSIFKNIFFAIAIIIHVKTPKPPLIQKPPEQQDYLPYLN
jgi:hypothetical protein